MLQKLQITNFQSHEDSTITFSPNVTAIIGANNHGKSAVLRSLLKAIRNVPDGTSFIKDGCKKTSILVTADTGIVERSIKNTVAADSNKYVIDNVEFVKFGKTGIPVELYNALAVDPIQIFGDEELDLNFQNQLDDMFLMQGSGVASLRGKVLGKVIGIDKIQRGIQVAGRCEKEQTSIIKNNTEALEKLNIEFEQFIVLDDVQNRLAYIKDINSSYIDKITNVQALQSKQLELKNIIASAKAKKLYIQTLPDINLSNLQIELSTLCLLKDIQNTQLRIEYLQQCVDELPDCTDLLQETKDAIVIYDNLSDTCILTNHIDDIEYSIQNTPEVDIYDSTLKMQKLDKLYSINACNTAVQTLNTNLVFVNDVYKSVFESLTSLAHDIELYTKVTMLNANNVIDEKSNLITQLELDEANAVEALTSYKEELGICPLCNKPFTENHND